MIYLTSSLSQLQHIAHNMTNRKRVALEVGQNDYIIIGGMLRKKHGNFPTARIQTMDDGIIAAIKQRYTSRQIGRVLHLMYKN